MPAGPRLEQRRHSRPGLGGSPGSLVRTTFTALLCTVFLALTMARAGPALARLRPAARAQLGLLAARVAAFCARRQESGLKALGDPLLASAAGGADTPAPEGPTPSALLLASLPALLQLVIIGYALYVSWVCYFRRERLARLSWWLRYHTALFAVRTYVLRWRDYPFDPLLIAWSSWCVGGAWASRWWALPPWTRGPGIKELPGLMSDGLSLAVVLYFMPVRYLGIAAAVLAAGLGPVAAQRLRRAPRTPGAPLSVPR